MKSRTSFFNPAVLRKDITRFAPLWGLYTVFMLMTLFLIWANENEPHYFATSSPYIMQMMGIVNCVYAGLCAILLFGDLFTSKMAGALHAMPMRREGWFLTHLCAGLLFCLVPNALGALLACIALQQYCYLAFIWLAIMLCQFLFFFGVGAFSIQCAGNRLGAAAIYGLINLLAVLVTFLVITFYEPVLYGIKINTENMLRGSPVVGFTMFPYVAVEYDNMYGVVRFEGFVPGNWRYLFIATAIGIGLLGCAVLLYRKRQLESAGDFIAVRPAEPVFLVLYALCVGAVLYFLADLFGTDAEYLFLVLGFAIGFFTGHMLLEKKVNVFQLKKWIGFGVLTFAFFLTIALAWMDPLGITRYVPEKSSIQQVHISPYTADYYIQNQPVVLTEDQDVQAVLDLHKQQTLYRSDDSSNTTCLRIRYYLKSGATVEREYRVPVNSESAKVLKNIYTGFSQVTGFASVAEFMQRVQTFQFYSHTNELPCMEFCQAGDENAEKYGGEEWITVESAEPLKRSEYVKGLMKAVYADCQAGNMAQLWDFHNESVGSLQVCYMKNGNYLYLDITVYDDSVNTIAYLEYLDGLVATQSAVTLETEDILADVA